MAASESIDIASHEFALRLANLLISSRARDGRGVGHIARASNGRFSKDDLKAFEHARGDVDEGALDELVQLYRCDLGEILPMRLAVVVGTATISAGGVHQAFESTEGDALLAAYLTLVRTLRHERKAPVVDLRRDDIEVLAGYLHEPSESIVHRLATLMYATQTKRTAMVGVFAAGAAVIGLVGSAFALGGTSSAPRDEVPAPSVSVSTTLPPNDTTVAPTDSAGSVATTTRSNDTAMTPSAVTATRSTTAAQPTTTTSSPPLIEIEYTTTSALVADGSPPVPPAVP